MLKVILTLLLTALITALCMCQSPVAVKAPNVSIGKYSVWSVYPDVADFVLDYQTQRLMISIYEGPEDSDWNTQHYLAIVGQVAEHVYRAEVSESFWVEVNALTGETFWYNYCLTTCYRLPCRDDHSLGVR